MSGTVFVVRGFRITLAAVLVAIGIGVGISAVIRDGDTIGAVPPPGSYIVRPTPPLGRITVAGGCPSAFQRYRGIRNTLVDFGSKLLPSDPSAARVCRYDVDPSGRPLPVVARLVGRAEAGNLASVVDLLSTAAVRGFYSCPAMFSGKVILAFSYGGRSDIDLWYFDSGCQTLDNGTLGAFSANDVADFDAFSALVTQLAPPASSPGSAG